MIDNESTYTVYTKPDCGFCDSVKKVLQIQRLTYSEVNVENNDAAKQVVREGWQSLGFDTPTVPLIVRDSDNSVIGGFTELTALLTT